MSVPLCDDSCGSDNRGHAQQIWRLLILASARPAQLRPNHTKSPRSVLVFSRMLSMHTLEDVNPLSLRIPYLFSPFFQMGSTKRSPTKVSSSGVACFSSKPRATPRGRRAGPHRRRQPCLSRCSWSHIAAIARGGGVGGRSGSRMFQVQMLATGRCDASLSGSCKQRRRRR